MIYINSNSQIVEFPRFVNGKANKVVLVHQITHQTLEIPLTMESKVYLVDVSEYVKDMVNGQYDYFIYNDNIVLNTGILQYGEYTTNKNQYETNINIVQYNPN